ncbi:hypothetical protein [Delftia tsuruhatensis]|uniref:hypothetical protein n=1 Tax=Delftia tsuruhatensis TaxID=180282 RepID=UPI001F2ECB23|nr:hypothetical protein [Delftia tsuruhatensis]
MVAIVQSLPCTPHSLAVAIRTPGIFQAGTPISMLTKNVAKPTQNHFKIKHLQKSHSFPDFFAAPQHQPLDSFFAIPTIRPMLHCNMTFRSSQRRHSP